MVETESCSSGRVCHTAKQRKWTCVGLRTVEMGSCSSRGVWRTAKRDSTGYCSSTVYFLQPPPATVHPSSTSSSLHQLLFIHGGPVHPASTGNCSSNPPWGPVHPASTSYCSTSPPRGPVQPTLHEVPPPATVH